jgi:Na+-transporting methylmalonyl-CoA/oxaloacetate decarboxylase gamma subunit
MENVMVDAGNGDRHPRRDTLVYRYSFACGGWLVKLLVVPGILAVVALLLLLVLGLGIVFAVVLVVVAVAAIVGISITGRWRKPSREQEHVFEGEVRKVPENHQTSVRPRPTGKSK